MRKVEGCLLLDEVDVQKLCRIEHELHGDGSTLRSDTRHELAILLSVVLSDAQRVSDDDIALMNKSGEQHVVALGTGFGQYGFLLYGPFSTLAAALEHKQSLVTDAVIVQLRSPE